MSIRWGNNYNMNTEAAQLHLKVHLNHTLKSYGLILPHANVLFSHWLYGQKNSEG